MFSVLNYGARADGKTLDRVPFQAAIDACAAAGGGTVFVPAGTYLLGTVILRSGVHIRFEDGVKIIGSPDYEVDYLPREPFSGGKYQDDSHTFFDHSLFLAKECHDIGMSGRATIDMQCIFTDLDHGQYYRAIKVITLVSCTDIVLADMTILGATDLAIWLYDCERARLHGLSLDVLVDGITPDACRDMVISDCLIKADDDALVFKTSFPLGRFCHSKNIAVRNCTISSNASAIKIGTETNGDFENISITGCVLKDTRRAGIAIESVDGANIRGLVISNVTMYRVGSPIFIRLGARMRAPEGTPIGSMKDITLSSIHADFDGTPYHTHYIYLPGQQNIGPYMTPFPYVPIIAGIPDHPIENLTIRDVSITMPGGVAVRDALPLPLPENETAYPDTKLFGYEKHLPAACMVMRHVHGYREKHLVLRTHKPDERPMAIYEDVE